MNGIVTQCGMAAQASGAWQELLAYVASEGLTSNFVGYDMRAASGSSVAASGGLTSNAMTLVGSPTLGLDGITFNGIDQYGTIADFLASETLTVFNRLEHGTSPPSGIIRLMGRGDFVLNNLSFGVAYAGNLAGDPYRIARNSSGGSGSSETVDTTNETHTTASQTLVNQWIDGGGRSMWQNKTMLSLSVSTPQTSMFDSNEPVIYAGVFNNAAILQPSDQKGVAVCFVTGTITTAQREAITDLINAL